jgi:hypothetical protein
MTKSPEQHRSESLDQSEQAKIMVERFIGFTINMLADKSRSVDHVWTDQMHRLYGDPESFDITKLEVYKGIPDVKESFIAAYVQGGLAGLKLEFLSNAILHTNILSIGDETKIVLERIIDYDKTPNNPG